MGKNSNWFHVSVRDGSVRGKKELRGSVGIRGSVGSFYLYGPDKKLITSTNKWDEVKKKLEESLEEHGKE